MLQIVDVAAIQVLEETEETADVDLALATIAVSGLLFFLYAVAALALDAVEADVAVTTAVSGLSCF